jgi:hypothetical protein
MFLPVYAGIGGFLVERRTEEDRTVTSAISIQTESVAISSVARQDELI